MIKKIIILTFILICILFNGSAQDTTLFKSGHLFGIYTGYSNHIIKDDIISPLLHKGTKVPIGLEYSYQSDKSKQAVSVFYNELVLKSSISNSQFSPFTNNINAELGYSYNRKLYSISKINTDFYLGGKFICEISYREHFYNNYYNEVSGEQMTSVGFNFIILKKFINSSNDHLYFNFNMPLVAYSVLNNRYNVIVGEATDNIDEDKNLYWEIFKNGEFVTLNNLQEFQTILCYTMFVSKCFGLEFKHQFHFYNIVQYKDTFYARHLNNQFSIGIIIKIQK